MNKLNPLRRQQAGRFASITNSILALLLMVGLVQIAVCFHAAVGLVPPVAQINTEAQLPAYVTNAPVARDVAVPTNEKS